MRLHYGVVLILLCIFQYALALHVVNPNAAPNSQGKYTKFAFKVVQVFA